jgi:hypothetical protein
MAARRLLIVMLVLLAMSMLAAALAPSPGDDETTSSTTSTTTAGHRAPAGGELVEAKLDADAARPQTIRVPLGDQLSLAVSSRRAGQAQIAGLGLVEDVARLAPARFDLLADHRGRYEVRLVDPPRTLGVIVLGGR